LQDNFLQQKRHLRRDVLVGCVGWIEESTHPLLTLLPWRCSKIYKFTWKCKWHSNDEYEDI